MLPWARQMNRRRLISAFAASVTLAPYDTAARAQVEDISLTLTGSAADNSATLQAAINRGYGKRINLTGEAFFNGVSIDPRTDAGGIQLVGRGAQGVRGSVLRNVGTGDAITIRNLTGKPYDGAVLIKDLGLHGSPRSGNGIVAEEINGQFVLDGLWLDGHGKTSIVATRCYSMTMRSCLSVRPGQDGIAIIDAGNNILMEHVRSFGSKGANIRIGGRSTAFAPVLIAPDVSDGQLGLVVENAIGVAVTGLYCEANPVAARFAANSQVVMQGGIVLNGRVEALGVGAITGVAFRGGGGLIASLATTVTGCTFSRGATMKRKLF